MMPIDLTDKFRQFDATWTPHVVAEQHIRRRDDTGAGAARAVRKKEPE